MIIVEVLGRRGQLLERVRVTQLPFTLGRDYSNDLILDDRTVSARHAVVERDEQGGLVLVDRDSENGSYRAGTRQRVPRIALSAGAEVRLGAAAVRFRPPEHAVPPTQVLDPRPPLVHWALTHWTAVLAGLALVVGFNLWSLWRAAYSELDAASVAQQQLGLVALMGLWAGGWALFGRLLVQSARFVGHWAAMCAYLLGQTAVTAALSYARFAFAPILAIRRVDALLGAALVGAVLWLHLNLATALRARGRLAVALAAALLFYANQELELRQDNTDWVQTLPYWSRLKPVPADWLPAEAADHFFENARALRPELDELAVEIREERARRR